MGDNLLKYFVFIKTCSSFNLYKYLKVKPIKIHFWINPVLDALISMSSDLYLEIKKLIKLKMIK